MNSDGTVTPVVAVQLGPVTMGPGSARIPPAAVSFGGPRIADFLGRDLDVQIGANGVHQIVGYF